MKKPAIFLDRDGTINEEMGYINHPDRFIIFPFVYESINIFKKLGFKVFVVTNQSGVARGYFREEIVKLVHKNLSEYLNQKGLRLDGIYYCPHHPDGIINKYSRVCNCRKPKPGMIQQAVAEHDIDLKNSLMIGDRYKDIEFGTKLNLKTGLVLTGYGRGEYEYQRKDWLNMPDIIGDNLLDIAKKIESFKKSEST